MVKLDNCGVWETFLPLLDAIRRMAMDAAQNGKASAEQKSGYKDRPWIPRFWDGMCLGGLVPAAGAEPLRHLAQPHRDGRDHLPA